MRANLKSLCLLAATLTGLSLALAPGMCDKDTKCVNGACCSTGGNCGYSPDFCGAGTCISNCDAKAECGQYATAGNQSCPLNVCCSKFGFCGVDSSFCDQAKGCQNNCGPPKRPACTRDDTALKRTVGYYESWANGKACQKVSPEDLNVDGFTDINFGFLMFDPKTFCIAPSDVASLKILTNFTNLKAKNPGLKTWVSVGGWSFNDPGPTETAFSDMAKTPESRSKFINETLAFMRSYAFDGLDLDWEYPVAPDRGGRPEDKANYVALAAEIKAAFGDTYGLSMTLPMSYFYMKHFDIEKIQDSVDFFNLMSYDIHGVWDNTTEVPGPYIRPHTNVTEIDEGLDLMWRAKVDPSKVNLGLAWYGRSFTLADAKCSTPNGICKFTDGGVPGNCSNSTGTLNLQEIQGLMQQYSIEPTLEDTAAVKYMAFNETQWVSFDDKDTIALKQQFANSRCLGGAMVWAMDQVDQKDNVGLSKAIRPSPVPDSIKTLLTAEHSTDCVGQWMTKSKATRSLFKHWTRQSNPGCEALSMTWGMPTGTLVTLTGSDNREMKDSDRICVPKPCDMMVVTSKTPTCEALAASVGGNITATLIESWNPDVLGGCGKLSPGQSVCISPYGGWYNLAAPPILPFSSSGSDSTSATEIVQSTNSASTMPPANTGNSSTGAISSSPSSSPLLIPTAAFNTTITEARPSATTTETISYTLQVQPGVASNCNRWANAQAGEDCDRFANDAYVKTDDLFRWNPVLGISGEACSTAFIAGNGYCLGTGAGLPIPSVTASFTGTRMASTGLLPSYPLTNALSAASGPSASTTRTTASSAYATAMPGDTCDSFASAHGIQVAQLVQWNPVVGTNCTGFRDGYIYNVGSSGAATASVSSTARSLGTAASLVPYVSHPNTLTGQVTSTGSQNRTTVTVHSTSWVTSFITKSATSAAFNGSSEFGTTDAQTLPATSTTAADSGDTPSSVASSSESDPTSGRPTSFTTLDDPSGGTQASITAPAGTDSTVNARPSPVPTAESPKQTGMASNCNKFAPTLNPDRCADFIKAYDVSLEDFFAWNPAVGKDCTNLWEETWYCVGVGS